MKLKKTIIKILHYFFVKETKVLTELEAIRELAKGNDRRRR